MLTRIFSASFYNLPNTQIETVQVASFSHVSMLAAAAVSLHAA